MYSAVKSQPFPLANLRFNISIYGYNNNNNILFITLCSLINTEI